MRKNHRHPAQEERQRCICHTHIEYKPWSAPPSSSSASSWRTDARALRSPLPLSARESPTWCPTERPTVAACGAGSRTRATLDAIPSHIVHSRQYAFTIHQSYSSVIRSHHYPSHRNRRTLPVSSRRTTETWSFGIERWCTADGAVSAAWATECFVGSFFDAKKSIINNQQRYTHNHRDTTAIYHKDNTTNSTTTSATTTTTITWEPNN